MSNVQELLLLSQVSDTNIIVMQLTVDLGNVTILVPRLLYFSLTIIMTVVLFYIIQVDVDI